MSARLDGRQRQLQWPLVPVLLVVLAVCLAYTYAFAFLGPYSGLTLNSGWVIIQIDPCEGYPGWCEAHPLDLHVGDQVTAVGDLTHGESLGDRRRVLFDGYGPGDRVPITVLREGQREVVDWLMPVPTDANQLSALVGLLFYLPFWFSGTAVLLFLQPRDARWWLLVAFCYLIAIWLATGLVSATRIAASSLVAHAVSWVLVPVCLHLHLLMPVPLPWRGARYAMPLLYGAAAILAVLEFGQFLPAPLGYTVLFLSMVTSLGLLVSRLFGASPRSARPAVRLMLAGIGLSLGPGLVVGLVSSLLDPAWPQVAVIAVALLAVPVLPLSYTYAIYKHFLGPLEFRANRLLSLYSFVLLSAIVFVSVFVVGGQWIGQSTEMVAFSFVVSVLFVIVASATSARFQRLVDRLVYGTRYSPDDLIRAFASQIPAALTLQALVKLLSEQVGPSLLIRQAALCSLTNGDPRLVYAAGVHPDDVPRTHQQIQQLLADAWHYRPIPPRTDGARDQHSRGPAYEWVRLVIPLELRQRTAGLWLFGRRDPDDYYPQEDINLLGTLADQVTVALENIHLYEQAQSQIADRQLAEAAARQERDRAQRYLDIAGVMLVALNQEGEIVLLNRRGNEILGYQEGELVGRNWFDTCLPAQGREESRRRFRAMMSAEDVPPDTHANSVLTRSGQERIIAWHDTVLTDDLEEPVGTLSSGEDITERVQAEEARTRLIAAVEQTEEAIVILDDLGRIQYVNPAFVRITGYAEKEVLGQGEAMLEGRMRGAELYPELWRSLERSEAWAGRLPGKKKDGSAYEAEVSISPIHDPSRQATEYVIIQRDVTQEVALEAQLRQALKMEAIGQLAGGVAHDFNNLLTAIMGYAEFALSSAPAGSALQGDIQEIQNVAERAAVLTRQLLAFSRKQVLQPRVLDLNDVIANMHRMLRRLIREDIELVTLPAPDLGLVRADPGQIEQVIVNLVVNARDAMSQGGILTLKTTNVWLDAAYARRYLDVRPGPYVEFSVSDTGIGMTKELQSHIFEPFFTTKKEGEGTGLGLATVYGIIKQSGGHIDVDSEAGVGSTFRIYLPRLGEQADEVEQRGTLQAMPRGTERILVVEDEDAVRTLARRTLERQGYVVLDASRPRQALQIIEVLEEPIDMLLTDVVMPEMNGKELADRVAQARPEIKIMFMSGYTDDAILDRGALEPGVVLLHKPFTPADLARKVREVLGPLPQDA